MVAVDGAIFMILVGFIEVHSGGANVMDVML